MPRPPFEPKLLTCLREGYDLRAFGRDALAGVVVGVVALPLAIAFGIASGVRPEQGLYTAIIAGFLVSLLGGSRVQIGGPTGAFVVIVAGIVAEHGYAGLAMATMMAGALMIVMGLARLGDVIRFVPYPVTVGFTSGIACLIAAGQLGDALGLPADGLPAELPARLLSFARSYDAIDPGAAALCAATILTSLGWTRLNRRVPGPLVALVATTAVAAVLGLPVETIGSRFGGVPSHLPAPQLPTFDWQKASELVSPAISIALLGAIESLLSALVADGAIGGRHRSNTELIAQGVANLASPVFGGIPATGAIARTATNVRNGGRTPVAGMVHAVTLLVILLVAGDLAAAIPMATLAGILLLVAYHMSEWHVFVRLLRGPRSDVLVLLTTFVLTVAVDLAVAIQVGVVLAALLFMRRMAEVSEVNALKDVLDYGLETEENLAAPDLRDLPPEIEVFEIHGSFCFGAARKFAEALLASRRSPRVVILRMRHVLAIDATGLHALEDVASRLSHRGAELLLTAVQDQPLRALESSGALDRLGRDHLLPSFAAARERALEIVAARGDESVQG